LQGIFHLKNLICDTRSLLSWPANRNADRQHAGKSRRHSPASKVPLPVGIWTHPHLTRSSIGPPESTSKRHLDRFSRFCRAHGRYRQTDRRRYSVCSNRPHLASAALWHNKYSDAILGKKFHFLVESNWQELYG